MITDLNHLLDQIHKDKGIPKDSLIEAIEAAMLSAARKKMGFYGDLEAQFNPDIGEVELFQFKIVVDKVEDEDVDISIEDAHKLDSEAQVGDELGVKVDSSVLGRIAAQTAKQVIIQKLRDAEKNVIVDEYEDKLGQVLTGIVRRFEKGDIVIDLNKAEAVIRRREQIDSEAFKTGDRIQGYFFEIDTKARGPMIQLSRKHPLFVKCLFEMEVPEVSEGIVEIKSVSRDAGIRSKIAVYSADSDVDPVGACVGLKGSRVQAVVQELRGEKIDIVLYDHDPAKFVCNAIAPAQVSKLIILDKANAMEVIVPDDQLSLAIGRKGQNVRLAANLTGWSIDIYSESKVEELSKFAKEKLSEELEISEALATVLYSHAFRSVEEIADTALVEFMEIPGMDPDVLKTMHSKAKVLCGEEPEELGQEAVSEEVEEVVETTEE